MIKNKIHRFLRWTEKWTKTDMLYVAKGGFWLLLTQASASILAFLLSIAFANLLPKEIYGSYKYLLSLAGIIGAFSLTGMNIAVAQAVAKGFEGALKRSVIVQMKWGVIQVLVGLAGGAYFFFRGNSTFAASFLIIGILSPLLNSAYTYLAFINGKKDFKTYARFNSLTNLISSASIFITILFSQNLVLMVSVYFLSNTLANGIFYFLAVKKYRPGDAESPDTIPYGKHLSLINVANVLAANADKILVFQLLGPVSLANYYFATAIPNQFRGILKIIQSLALPKLSQSGQADMKKSIFDKAGKIALSTAAFVLAYIFLARYIYQYIFPQYFDSLPYSQVFSLSLVFTASSMFLLSVLQAKIEIKSLYKYNLAGSAFQIASLSLLTYFFGLWGAILSNILNSFFSLLLSYFLVKKI